MYWQENGSTRGIDAIIPPNSFTDDVNSDVYLKKKKKNIF